MKQQSLKSIYKIWYVSKLVKDSVEQKKITVNSMHVRNVTHKCAREDVDHAARENVDYAKSRDCLDIKDRYLSKMMLQ